VECGLAAPLQRPEGRLVVRGRDTPQGAAISLLLANILVNYTRGMAREYLAVSFERYCDNVVVHLGQRAPCRNMRTAIADRLAEVGFILHPDPARSPNLHCTKCGDMMAPDQRWAASGFSAGWH
jgi:RNA-directed DNA polymerase